MAEALLIIPIVSALTGTSMMAMLTMGPEGGIIKCVKRKVNGMYYDDQIWNKTNTSTGQLSVQFTALTQWMSTMAQYGNTRQRQLNAVRLELSLPIRREFKDNDGKIKVLEPYPLVPHYYHVPRVGQCWRFSLSHFPALAKHRQMLYPQNNPSKRQRKKIDQLYSVWIESIGYKATDDVTGFKITWPKDNPTLFNYWNTMIWMLTRYDFNTGLVMENIRSAMQPNPQPLLENDVLALFAQVKEDDLRIQKEMKEKEDAIVSPYSSATKTKNTCQTTTLDVPLSFNYRSNHPASEKPKKKRREVVSSDDEDDSNHRSRPKQVVLVLKTSSSSSSSSSTTKNNKSKSNSKSNSRPASPSGSGSMMKSGLFSKKIKDSPQGGSKKMTWANDDTDDEGAFELSENPLVSASLNSPQVASMLARLSMAGDDDFHSTRKSTTKSKHRPTSRSHDDDDEFDSPAAQLQAQTRGGMGISKKKGVHKLSGRNRLNGEVRRPSIDV